MAPRYAARGYAVVAVNFHGSTGFGEKFCDSIRGDWGGQPFRDVMAAVDWAIATFDWIDGGRVAALGASYGGYMMNWINGHTQRFEVLVLVLVLVLVMVVVMVVLLLVVDFGGYDDGDVSVNKKCRFKCLVAHGAIFSLRNLYYTTEELWCVSLISVLTHCNIPSSSSSALFLIQVSGVGIRAAVFVG